MLFLLISLQGGKVIAGRMARSIYLLNQRLVPAELSDDLSRRCGKAELNPVARSPSV